MKLKIPVFWHSKETQVKENLDINVSIDECETRIVTFYTIDSVTDYKEGDGMYSTFYCCGEVYYSPLSRIQLETMIDEEKEMERK